ncbi:hypothetical protein RRG08_031057 [Elysia crispata]|uniref:Uncharacterized protein n=1 Tax=Elysia crispata TaxID=231223 RepID=A0AAE0ZF40_9GAST|nr:hypothetical protein RRG08_031057 [Elysia crispata]
MSNKLKELCREPLTSLEEAGPVSESMIEVFVQLGEPDLNRTLRDMTRNQNGWVCHEHTDTKLGHTAHNSSPCFIVLTLVPHPGEHNRVFSDFSDFIFDFFLVCVCVVGFCRFRIQPSGRTG